MLIVAACGDLPEPFLGNPGATARRLSVPMTPMLAVPPPADALLGADGAQAYADSIALGLRKEEIPALVRAPGKNDWRLAITAMRNGDRVVPRYAVLDPFGKEQGAIDGAAVPATGWTSGWPPALGQAADDAVPKIMAVMMSIRATRDRTDPNSLLNRVAKLYVPEVTGAPGDGNQALTRLVRERLREFGSLVQSTPENADFTVKGEVSTALLPDGQQKIEIVWTVTRPSGVVSGKVSQLNSVPPGTLDRYWGDVAAAVAQEASGGINTVVARFIGRDGSVPGAGSASPEGIPKTGTAAAR